MAEPDRKRARYSVYDRAPNRLAYDGSAVRRLEPEELPQPKPLVRPRERSVERPRIRVREAGKVSPFAVVGFLAVAVFSVLLLMGYIQLAAISNEVVELRSEMTQLKTEEAKLRAQYELAYDLGTIEETVTSSGQMVKPQNSQIYYVDLSEPDSVERFERDSAGGGVLDFLEGARDACGQLVEYFR